MGALRERMDQDMVLRGLADRTREDLAEVSCRCFRGRHFSDGKMPRSVVA